MTDPAESAPAVTARYAVAEPVTAEPATAECVATGCGTTEHIDAGHRGAGEPATRDLAAGYSAVRGLAAGYPAAGDIAAGYVAGGSGGLCDAERPRARRVESRESGCARWDPPGLRIDEPSEFIAAVPALLGFVPDRSLVVCLLQEAEERPGSVYLGAVARHDLPPDHRLAQVRMVRQLAAICAQEGACGALVLIVDDREDTAGRDRARAGGHLMRMLAGALLADGVDLADAWMVGAIGAGQPWWSLLDPEVTGTQSDPAASPVALAQVLDGRPIRAGRAELAAVVAADPERAAEVAGVLPAAAEAAARARCAVTLHAHRRALLEQVLDRVRAVASDAPVRPRDIAELAVALRDTVVRDVLFALPLTAHAPAAETLWAQLCRALTGPDRAEAATLLGYSAYARGDGPVAGVALAAAAAAEPRHTLAALLETALRTGMPPHEVRRLAHSGMARAATLGVDLGIDPRWHA
ncbi:DUF4192 domain-containing protein [Nocardia sp. alder85J]|uniref:DUF4192 domain-containing protein n=1 Tax=Nocardia sp. alder85J TaxID=2862949 RepID=UPI001CD32BBB|nr:DUF4192 domain-containing protein [Nocardia sp. alder85J]MCX4094877.1 DUF4192 domain-containing protein [Nocardia sp. alder85J]